MKTSLSLVLIVAAASTLAACSSDEGTPRTPTGTGATAGTGGTGTGVAGASTGGAGGTGTGGTGTGGTGGTGAGTAYNLGDALTITADGNVEDATGDTGIIGGAILAQSTNMAVVATTAHVDGSLCISGTTEVVPTAADYGTYWGAELALDLKRVPVAGAPVPVADAGADAGAAPATQAGPWPYGDVIGFSYKLTGKDAAAADKGVPATQFRFKALPVGSNSQNDTYCSTRNGLTDGEVDNVLFSDITFECWAMGNISLAPAEATIQRVDPGPPRVVNTPPNPKELISISWQIASDIPPVTRIPFNFCISDLKPILATP